MGEVRVSVELENYNDREVATRGLLPEDQVRSQRVNVVADTGAMMLALPQDLVEALGLRVLRKAIVTYADERKEERDIAGVVRVKVAGRSVETNCIVGPPGSEPLLGQIVLEATDLLVDCANQRLMPRPESPYLPTLKLKQVRETHRQTLPIFYPPATGAIEKDLITLFQSMMAVCRDRA